MHLAYGVVVTWMITTSPLGTVSGRLSNATSRSACGEESARDPPKSIGPSDADSSSYQIVKLRLGSMPSGQEASSVTNFH